MSHDDSDYDQRKKTSHLLFTRLADKAPQTLKILSSREGEKKIKDLLRQEGFTEKQIERSIEQFLRDLKAHGVATELRAHKLPPTWFFFSFFIREKSKNDARAGFRLEKFTDWVPSKELRKKLLKLIADDRAEINEARFHGRKWLAGWRKMWLCVNWWRYLISEPLTRVAGLIKRSTS